MKVKVEWGVRQTESERYATGSVTHLSPLEGERLASQLALSFGQDPDYVAEDCFWVTRSEPRKEWWSADRKYWVAISRLVYPG